MTRPCVSDEGMRKDVLPIVVRAMKTFFIQPQKLFGRRDTRLQFQDSFPVFIPSKRLENTMGTRKNRVGTLAAFHNLETLCYSFEVVESSQSANAVFPCTHRIFQAFTRDENRKTVLKLQSRVSPTEQFLGLDEKGFHRANDDRQDVLSHPLIRNARPCHSPKLKRSRRIFPSERSTKTRA